MVSLINAGDLWLFRMAQVAAAEEQLRAEGKIDKDGHLKHAQSSAKKKPGGTV